VELEPNPAPQAPAFRPADPYGPRQAALALASYFAAQVATGVFVGILVGLWYGVGHRGRPVAGASDIMATAMLVGGAAGVLVGGIVAWCIAKHLIGRNAEGISLAALGYVRGTRRAQATAAAAGIVIGLGFIGLTTLVPMPDTAKPGWTRVISAGGWPQYLWIVFALFIAPPIEEFVFRGMLWTGLRRRWNAVAAGTVVTLSFLAVHVTQAGGYWPAMVAIGTMGAAALVARVRSGSLVPAVALHVSYNAMVVMSAMPV
jgi:ABC-2 type transport system permease protein